MFETKPWEDPNPIVSLSVTEDFSWVIGKNGIKAIIALAVPGDSGYGVWFQVEHESGRYMLIKSANIIATYEPKKEAP